MVFSSPIFLYYFLPIVLLLYFILPARNLILFAFSLLFYAWGESQYVLILLVSIGINYFFGRFVGAGPGPVRRRVFLGLGVAANLSLLVFFKYANFILANVNQVLSSAGHAPIHAPAIHLPLGISFFTFQAISYLVDVYRKDAEVVRNPLDLGLYIAMFPQLVAGPIVRFADIADQINGRGITARKFSSGIRRFMGGLAQKMLIANTLAVPADAVFSMSASDMTTPLAWLGVLSFSFQIYFDFSGYSSMAIGLGRIFGFSFCENFNFPYISRSITEFWRRWHISLSTWFRDYLYIPLGGNRRGAGRTYVNLLIVFLLCGLWHGASWTFIFWGLFHGACLVIERVGFRQWVSRRPALAHCYALLAVCFGWALFRSDSLHQAVDMIQALCGISSGDGSVYNLSQLLTPAVLVALPVATILSMPAPAWVTSRLDRLILKREWAGAAGWGKKLGNIAEALAVCMVLLLVGFLMAEKTNNPFIYFRF